MRRHRDLVRLALARGVNLQMQDLVVLAGDLGAQLLVLRFEPPNLYLKRLRFAMSSARGRVSSCGLLFVAGGVMRHFD